MYRAVSTLQVIFPHEDSRTGRSQAHALHGPDQAPTENFQTSEEAMASFDSMMDNVVFSSAMACITCVIIFVTEVF